jgi:hypothetical protein
MVQNRRLSSVKFANGLPPRICSIQMQSEHAGLYRSTKATGTARRRLRRVTHGADRSSAETRMRVTFLVRGFSREHGSAPPLCRN